ncbi:MAG: energy transducer TonB [Marinilabiliales bacterium]|nr:MAG: energy transducer TonB [Bacteroidia bacterium]TVR73740.1 MAG: energy transducer TonB [Marinilabiliales bacterium]
MQLFKNNGVRRALILSLLAATAVFAATCTKEILMQQDPPGQLQVPQLAPGSDNLYFVVEQMPYFKEEGKGYDGFRKFIAENIRYPEEAREQGIEGRVFVQLTVKDDGSVGNVNVVRGADPLLDREAVRVVEASPRWVPGMQNGKPVNVVFTMPVTFLLPGGEPDEEVLTMTVTSSPPKGEPEE